MSDDRDNDEGPKTFKDFSDVKRRKYYSEQNTITVEDFHSLIGEMFHFKEEVHCQVERDGRRCDHRHKRGWVGRRKDKQEALIGKDCGNQYFVNNQEFIKERERVNREGRIESHVAGLTELLKDKHALLRRLHELAQMVGETLNRRRDMEAALPFGVVGRILDMVKTGNRSITVEAQFLEEVDEKGHEKKIWSLREIGALRGVAFWEDNRDLYVALEGVKKAVNDAVVSKNQKEGKLRKWRETIEQLPRIEERIENFSRSGGDFVAESNLAILCFLVSDQTKQIEVALLVLKARGEAKPTRPNAQKLLNDLNAQARKATQSLNIRVA